MRIVLLLICFIIVGSCKEDYKRPAVITEVKIEPIIADSTLNVRAIDFNDEYIFYGASDHIGKIALQSEFKINLDEFTYTKGKNSFKHVITYNETPLHFRAIEEVNGDLFAISIGNPARLYRLKRKAEAPQLVYEEVHENVFYDTMAFWNENEGIAIGDPTDGCVSIIITRDEGETWTKLSCNELPKAKEGEAAFAASDSNIAIVGDNTWIATGGMASRVFFSPDKGINWEVFDTPITQGVAYCRYVFY